MKTIEEIRSSILNKFFELSGLEIQDGTVLDHYSYASSDAIREAYIEIENNKNPYLYSKISGSNLDDLGNMVNCPREANEEDSSYLHRLIEWMISCEAANYDSIENALINLQYASHATYVPHVYGVGTAAVYIIPNSYDEETRQRAISEVRLKVNKVKSADSYVEYLIPKQKHVKLALHITFDEGSDQAYIIDSLRSKIQEYINGISIGGKLEIGEINKIGINETGVNYFVVVQMYIDDEPANDLSYLQTIHSKFVFDEFSY